MTELKLVIGDHYGGPEVRQLVEQEDRRSGPGEALVRVVDGQVSFTDAQRRAGTYSPGAPKPPFTPGRELVGSVEQRGPECCRLRSGDRIDALTVRRADTDRVCVPVSGVVAVAADLDPG